jgi:hypothetical protein
MGLPVPISDAAIAVVSRALVTGGNVFLTSL